LGVFTPKRPLLKTLVATTTTSGGGCHVPLQPENLKKKNHKIGSIEITAIIAVIMQLLRFATVVMMNPYRQNSALLCVLQPHTWQPPPRSAAEQ